ncbi:GspE/PulE family protein [Synechococcus sp. RSCCF101]|uniref:GspE/PulE family protein n=1 Tax=Synechococcus sp. RSCCF101 TaxID=2511069 RepID=UPI00177D6645|nr:GspE/PulE family protein [Synechococcus sp. RSCCF101]
MTLAPARPVPDAIAPEQQRLEVELLLQRRVLQPDELMGWPEAASTEPTLPLQRWRELGGLPVFREGTLLHLAIPTGWGEDEQSALMGAVQELGLEARLHLALSDDIEEAWALAEAQGDAATPTEKHETEAEAPVDLLSEEVLKGFEIQGALEEDSETGDAPDLEVSLRDTNSSPVITLVDRILMQALSMGASDIHVEPQRKGLQIRFRQDGVLQLQKNPLPPRLIPAVTSRFKIMADLDIAERRVPQDGRIRRVFKGRPIDFRVNTLPSRFGEKVVLRLLDSSATQLGLDRLVTDQRALGLVRDMGSKPFGIILVTGPTGSGKSTTLYSLLAERNDPGINISTVEDPIEYTLPGITQTQVNREKGLDFSTALRAFMRQDPDVLLVGETRDLETAKTAIEAALTGHLVLTTLHCNDAPSAIARLDEMGVEPFMVSASLLGIISQRLLRRVCPACREPYEPGQEDLGRFGLMASSEAHVTFYRARKGEGLDGTVCPRCGGSGYKGRVGVYEVLVMNETLASAVSKGAPTETIRRLALEAGMKSLLGYGLDLVREGHTTLEEVERMLLTDTGLESERRARALNTQTCEGCGAGLADEWLDCPYCLTPRTMPE